MPRPQQSFGVRAASRSGTNIASGTFAFDQSPALDNPGVWLNPNSTLTDAGGSRSFPRKGPFKFAGRSYEPVTGCAGVGRRQGPG